MTDERAPVEGATPDPSRDRARIEPSISAKKTDWLPIVYLVGFLVLAGAMYFLWQNPPETRLAAQDAGKVDTLQAQVASLRDTVTRLEQQKPPPAGPSTAEFALLLGQVNTLAGKPAASEAEVQTLQQQMMQFAQRPTATPEQVAQLTQQVQGLALTVQGLPKQTLDIGPLTQKIEELEKRPVFDPAGMDGKLGQLSAQLGGQTAQLADKVQQQEAKSAERLQQSEAKTTEAMQQLAAKSAEAVQQLAVKNEEADAKMAQTLAGLTARVDEIDKQQKATAQRAQLATKLQGAVTAMAAGQKLGPIAGAPPALARFATEAPPTEASLRESFDKYASDAAKVSQPAPAEDQDFGSRLWARAQQSVTVRQGDRVLVGDPIAGIVARAREQLDSGDLAGSVETLKALSGAAAKAMQPWTERAMSLLDARAAIAAMAAG